MIHGTHDVTDSGHENEAQPLKDGSDASIANLKPASFFSLVIWQSFGAIVAWICFVGLMMFFISACVVLVASTEYKIALLQSTANI